ncbi:repeatdomain containing protein, partial [Pyrenophora tritici-repentis]
MSLKFGLNLKNKGANSLGKTAVKPGLGKKKKPLLDDDDEEDVKGKGKVADDAQEIGELNFDDTLAAISSGSSKLAPAKAKKGQPPAPPSNKPKPKDHDPTTMTYSASAAEAEKCAQEALEANPTLYDYDAAYEATQAVLAAQEAAERDDTAERKPKYMDALFESAEQRKKDQMRARDKQLQREREAEGDEFADKEKFFGMQGFHKQMLAEREKRHQKAMEATAQALKDGVKPVVEEKKEKTDAEIVEELRKQGKNVILNDEGQIADKSQLLKAGLNIIAKPKPASTPTTTAAPKYTPPTHANIKGGRNAQRERQTAMIAEQIEAANKRKADEEAEEQAKIEHA